VPQAHQILKDAKNTAIAACYEYWLNKRERSGWSIPGRQHLDPVEMASFLRYVVLFDVERGGSRYRFRHRLTGTHFAQIFGREVTGLYIEDTGSVESVEAVHRRLSAVVDDKRLIYGISPAPVRERDFLRYEHLTLPLASDGATVDMLFGVRCILPLPPAEPTASDADD
jgi:hypothetical protein